MKQGEVRVKALFRVVIGTAILLASFNLAGADKRSSGFHTTSAQAGYLHLDVRWETNSEHPGYVHAGSCYGHDRFQARCVNIPAAEKTTVTGSGGFPVTVVKYRLELRSKTPLAGKLSASARAMACPTSFNSSGVAFSSSALAQKNWHASNIEGNRMYDIQIGLKCWKGLPDTVSGHIELVLAPTLVAVTSPGPSPQLTEFYDAGIVAHDSNGDLVVDSNDELVYEVPPAVYVEFNSEVSLVGGSAEYVYTFENFSDEDRSFTVPQLITAQHPGGWSGVVPANGTQQLVVTDTELQAYRQRAQISLDIPDSGGTYELAAGIYVPNSNLLFDGRVAIDSVTHDPAAGNVVTFSITQQAATSVVLWRVEPGGYALAAEAEGTFGLGSHSLVDANFAPGQTNEYVVEVGIDPNSVASSSESIPNQ